MERMEARDRLARAVGIACLLVLMALPASAQSFGMAGTYPLPTPVAMQGRLAASDPVETRGQRLDLAFGVVSLSAAMVATGLTSSCLAAKTCHETIPITRWAFDRGPIWGVVGRASVSGLTHYLVARFLHGKWRTLTLVSLAVINVTDAALNLRTLHRIDRARR